EVEQQEYESERDRDDDHESRLRTLLVLELPAEHDRIARRQFHFLRDALLKLGDEATHIATLDVGLDDDPPLHVIATYLRGAADNLHLCDIPQAHECAVWRLDDEVPDRFRAEAEAIREAHVYVVPLI